MKLDDIRRKLALNALTPSAALDRTVTGGYASDLLSCAMGRAKEGNVWITLQGHPNVVAVANLLNLAGIIITEGIAPDEATLDKAEQQGIPILTTPLTTFTVIGRLFEMGVRGVD